MLGKQAKILSPRDVADLVTFADCSRHPLRNRVIVLLSAKAGLRAGEIAGLMWDMLVDASGEIGNVIELRDHAAKKGSGRLIPMHPDLADALSALGQASTGWSGHVVRSERGGPMTALSIVVWFKRAYAYVGLEGCSSHSGRRTFITRAARLVHEAGGSLRDVELGRPLGDAGSWSCSKLGRRTMASGRSKRLTWRSRSAPSSIRRGVVASLPQHALSSSRARAPAVSC